MEERLLSAFGLQIIAISGAGIASGVDVEMFVNVDVDEENVVDPFSVESLFQNFVDFSPPSSWIIFHMNNLAQHMACAFSAHPCCNCKFQHNFTYLYYVFRLYRKGKGKDGQ